MKFKTQSGSLYEINTDSKNIRRVVGTTETVRATNEWRKYSKLLPDVPTIGNPLYIFWGNDTPLLEGSLGNIPITITSVITEILKEE
jgi:hypothetical protein